MSWRPAPMEKSSFFPNRIFLISRFWRSGFEVTLIAPPNGRFPTSVLNRSSMYNMTMLTAGWPLFTQEEHSMERTATAVWSGELRNGKGSLSTQSGALSDTPYSFITRFENGKGTNPEELIAAAHAGCFTMALSAQLGPMQFPAQP